MNALKSNDYNSLLITFLQTVCTCEEAIIGEIGHKERKDLLLVPLMVSIDFYCMAR